MTSNFEQFLETEETLAEEYINDCLINFVEYAIAECNSVETSECDGNCYQCILNMCNKYKKKDK